MREVLRSTENCDANMQAKKLKVNQNKEQIAVVELSEIVRKVRWSITRSIITKASVYDNKWEVKNLTLENFQGDEIGSSSLFGVIQAVVSLVPVTSNYYYDNTRPPPSPQKEFKSYIPLSVTWLKDPLDNMTYKFRACNRSVRAFDVAHEHFCDLLSGEMEGGLCKNINLNSLRATHINVSDKITVTGDIDGVHNIFIRDEGAPKGLYKIDNVKFHFNSTKGFGGRIVPHPPHSNKVLSIRVSSIKPRNTERWGKYPNKICVQDDIKLKTTNSNKSIIKLDNSGSGGTQNLDYKNVECGAGKVAVAFNPLTWTPICTEGNKL